MWYLVLGRLDTDCVEEHFIIGKIEGAACISMRGDLRNARPL